MANGKWQIKKSQYSQWSQWRVWFFRGGMRKLERMERGPRSNSEKIALLRQALFADVDELERSGEIVLPEPLKAVLKALARSSLPGGGNR